MSAETSIKVRTIFPTGERPASGCNLPLIVHNEVSTLLIECDELEAKLVQELEKVRLDRTDYLAMQEIAQRQLDRWNA